jgi:hypothetical protein
MQTMTTSAPPAAKPARLNLPKVAKPKAAGKSYPILPETVESKELVSVIRHEADEFDALKGSLDIHKAELGAIALPFYFGELHGRSEIPSSVIAKCDDGEVLVEFQKRFKQPDPKTTSFDLVAAQVEAAMGEHYGRFGRFGYSFTIKGDLVPAEHAPAVLEGIQKVLAQFGCEDALSAKETITTTSDFHVARHTIFTPQQNAELDRVLPMVKQVKTKGRGFPTK